MENQERSTQFRLDQIEKRLDVLNGKITELRTRRQTPPQEMIDEAERLNEEKVRLTIG
jgi:hypothetical protein